MTTVDKFALELEAKGINNFVKAMDEAEAGLKKVRENMAKIAKENGFLDKELDRTSKKKRVKEKKVEDKKNKSAKTFNKSIDEGTKSLNKMLKTLMAISGMSIGINGLVTKSEQSAKNGTDLANQARNTTVKTEDIETAQTALRMAGLDENTLDNFISKLSDNQNNFLAYGAGISEIQQLISVLNGWDKSGKQIDYLNTDPINTIKSIATMLQSNNETDKRGLISQAKQAGLSEEIINFLTNPNFFKFWNDSSKLAIKNKQKTDLDQKNNAAIIASQKRVENEWNDLGEKFTPVTIALNNLAEKILREVNKMTPLFEEAMPALSGMIDSMLEWFKGILEKLKKYGLANDDNSQELTENEDINNFFRETGISKSLMSKIIELDKKVEYIDKGTGRAYLTDGTSYTKNSKPFGMRQHEIDYLDYLIENHQNEKLNRPYIFDSEQLMQQSFSPQLNASSYVIHLQEMHVNTDANNINDIINDGFKQSKMIVGNPATLFNHINNTR
ncbi:hypothetical protein RCS94_06425 [Orbaceae bacterium ac157xtp]